MGVSSANHGLRAARCAGVVLAALWTACGGDAGMMPGAPPEPVGTIPGQVLAAGETVTLDVSPYFSDPGGGRLTYAAASSAAGIVSVSQSAGVLTLVGVAPGAATVTVTASNAAGLSANQVLAVTVEPANAAPVPAGEIPPQTMRIDGGATVELGPYFSDPDGDPLTYAAVSERPGVVTAAIDRSRLVLLGVSAGISTVTVTATDPGGLSATQAARVTVEARNRAPRTQNAIPASRLAVGDTMRLDVAPYFLDPDGDDLSYAAASSDEDVASVTIAGSAVGVVGVAGGTVVLTVTATDPGNLTATQTAAVTVDDANAAPRPVGTIPAQSLSSGDTATVDLSAYFADPDGDDLSYAAVSSDEAVASAEVAGSTLTLVGLVAGTATVTVTATDPLGLSAMQAAAVTVTAGPGGFRDDFDTDSSLEDWNVVRATAAVREGVLDLRAAQGAPVGRVERDLALPLNSWTIRTRMGRATNATVSVAWASGHDQYEFFRFEFGDLATGHDYHLGFFDSSRGIWFYVGNLSGASDAIRDGPREFTDVTISFDGETLVISAGETELHRFSSFTNLGIKAALRTVTEVWLTSVRGTSGLFDYVEVSGTQGAEADAARQPAESAELRDLLTGARWTPLRRVDP